MSLSKDLGGLKEIFKAVTGIGADEEETEIPVIKFKCTCGYIESFECDKCSPKQVAVSIEEHINGCQLAKKAFK